MLFTSIWGKITISLQLDLEYYFWDEIFGSCKLNYCTNLICFELNNILKNKLIH